MKRLDTYKLRSQLLQIIDKIPNAVEAGLTEAGQTGTTRAQTLTRYKVRSQNGLQSRTLFRSNGPFNKLIIADTFYASWVNFGNGPPGSKIYPKRAKALRFEINGQIVFRKWVRASAPRPFMTETFEFEKTYALEAVARSVARTFERA